MTCRWKQHAGLAGLATCHSGQPSPARPSLRRTTGAAFLLPAIAATALLVACGGRGDALPPTHDPFHPAIIEHASPEQQEILADRRIEWEEYERTFFAYVACLDENGVPHREAELTERARVPVWQVGIGPYHQDDRDEVQRKSDQCYRGILSSVELAWTAQEGPTEQEDQAMRQEIVDCVVERTTLEIPDWSALAAVRTTLSEAELSILYGCMELVLEGDPSSLNRQ